MTNRYDLYAKIRWSAEGIISPERLNPLLEQLVTKLQNYVFEKDTIKAVLVDLDDGFNSGFIPTLCKGGWDIARFDCIDSSDSESVRAHNFNEVIRAGIISELLKFEISHYKTFLRISGVKFS